MSVEGLVINIIIKSEKYGRKREIVLIIALTVLLSLTAAILVLAPERLRQPPVRRIRPESPGSIPVDSEHVARHRLSTIDYLGV